MSALGPDPGKSARTLDAQLQQAVCLRQAVLKGDFCGEVGIIEEAMKDEIELLWTGLKVRVKDTFTSTFFIAWVIWNWRAILYIVYPMSMDLDERLNHLESNIYVDRISTWGVLLVGPLVSTLIFLLLLPWVTNKIDRIYQGYLVARRKAQVEAQSSIYYSGEDVGDVMERNKKLQIHLQNTQSDLDTANGRIVELEGKLHQLRNELSACRMDLGRTTQSNTRENARARELFKLLDEEGKREAHMRGLWRQGN